MDVPVLNNYITGIGQSSHSYLSVTGGMPIVYIPEQTYTVTTGNHTTIPCIVTSSPSAAKISWRHISKGISTDINVNSAKYAGGDVITPDLTIMDAARVDTGYYVCSATNIVGTGHSGHAYLTVTGSEYFDDLYECLKIILEKLLDCDWCVKAKERLLN